MFICEPSSELSRRDGSGEGSLHMVSVKTCCDLSSELSHRDGSDEWSQHMVSIRNEKTDPSIIIKYPLLSRALLSRLSSPFVLCFFCSNCSVSSRSLVDKHMICFTLF